MVAAAILECGTGQSKTLLQSLIFFLFSGFVFPPLDLAFLTAQYIEISVKLKTKEPRGN